MDERLISAAVNQEKQVRRWLSTLGNANQVLQDMLNRMTRAEFEEWKARTVHAHQ